MCFFEWNVLYIFIFCQVLQISTISCCKKLRKEEFDGIILIDLFGCNFWMILYSVFVCIVQIWRTSNRSNSSEFYFSIRFKIWSCTKYSFSLPVGLGVEHNWRFFRMLSISPLNPTISFFICWILMCRGDSNPYSVLGTLF